MNAELYSAVRQRVAVALAMFEDDSSAAVELELRFGVFEQNGEFARGMPTGLWYALFQGMYESPNTRVVAGFSWVEREDDGARVVHTKTHRSCVRECKSAIMPVVNMPLFAHSASSAVRVALSRETRLAENVCDHITLLCTIPTCLMRQRERRSLYLLNNAGIRSCWRFDFTRINNDQGYELEIEFDLALAVKQTPNMELSARSTAVMQQLDSLVNCLRYAIEQADRVYKQIVAQIVARREAEAERLRPKQRAHGL